MNLSDLVKNETENKPPRIVLHGVHGCGKSTWASKAPNPIFLLTEDGLTNIKVPHFPLAKDFDEVLKYIGLLIKEENSYKTFVIDTLDWLERLIWDKVCSTKSVKSIEDIGYGKGYTAAMYHWAKVIEGLNVLREKSMAIVLLAHNEIKPYSPPDTDSYDRYQIKLHKHAASKIEEWADIVLFANFKVYVNDDKGKAVNSEPERIIYTSNRPAWRAKTRYNLPEELPMDFDNLMEAIKNGKM